MKILCSICLQSDLSIVKTQCNHVFCMSCYLNHVAIKQKENLNVGCALCRQNLQNTEIYLYKDIEKHNYLSNLKSLISNSKIKKCFYICEDSKDKYNLISKNLKTFIEYFTKQFKKDFILVYELKELIKLSTSINSGALLFCDKTENIDKIYNIGISNMFEIVEIKY